VRHSATIALYLAIAVISVIITVTVGLTINNKIPAIGHWLGASLIVVALLAPVTFTLYYLYEVLLGRKE